MEAPLMPREMLFASATRRDPQLSPSGELLAFVAPLPDGAPNLWVATPAMDDARPVTRSERGIGAFGWTGADRYLFYVADRNGDENTHVHLVNVTDGTERDLTPFPNVQAGVLAVEHGLPGTILLDMDRRSPGRPEPYRADLATGELTLAAENIDALGFVADSRLAARGMVTLAADGAVALHVRETEAGPWREVYRVGQPDAGTFAPIGFTADDRAIVLVSSVGAPAARVLRLDLRTGETETVYADPGGHDVTEVLPDPVTGEARMVVVQRQRRELEVLDSRVAGDIACVRRRCRGDLSLVGRDRTDRIWLIQDNADNAPTRYELFDRHTRSTRPLFCSRDDWADYRLAGMEPFSVVSRDGLRLSGYLTFPPGAGRTHLPAVLTVHGGPWTRDVWGLRSEPQWLANRGYLAVSVDYRGSSGYGKDFMNAGDREWGGRMQDDLIDVVNHLVERRIADPARLAIFGGSYGGYAALFAAAFTPDVFACAVAFAAPSNLVTFLSAIPPSWRMVAEELYRRVGHPVTDRDFLWSRSPLSRVDHIRVPVLIAQGANDPRVGRRESEQIVAAMKKRDIPHEYLLFADEGHGFARPGSRLAFYAAAERFLAEHLGGRHEPDDT